VEVEMEHIPRAEIIAIGSELLLGQIVDTNSAFIAKRLADNGIEMVKTQTVGDDLKRMEETILDSMGRSDIIITTGGIGPTEDDLTREAIANVTNRPLTFQPRLMEQIEALIKRRGFRMAENNRVQAYIPEGSIPIENPKGTAPGFIVEGPNWVTLTLPGVPSEMEYLLENTVIPYLRKRFKLDRQIIRYRVLRACGLGESAIGLQIKDLMKESRNPTVGTLASIGDVKIRITARADSPEEADQLIQKMEQEIRNRIGGIIYGVDDETLQGNISRFLGKMNLSLSVAEIFTNGVVSQKLGGIGGVSLIQGVILPSAISQRLFLNLTEKEFDSLRKEPLKLAEALARRVRHETGTDLGLGVYGEVLEEQTPGEFRIQTYYSLATNGETESQELTLGGEPLVVRERSSIFALDFLRKYLLKLNPAI
jgi:nicotinamide-nucleotide amidase